MSRKNISGLKLESPLTVIPEKSLLRKKPAQSNHRKVKSPDVRKMFQATFQSIRTLAAYVTDGTWTTCTKILGL